PAPDQPQLRPRLGQGCAMMQPPPNAKTVEPFAILHETCRLLPQRRKQAHLTFQLQSFLQLKSRWRDSNNRVRLLFKHYGLSQRSGIAAEQRSPQPIAQNRYRSCARTIVVRSEGPALCGLDSKKRKNSC